MLILSLAALGLGPIAYRHLAARPAIMRSFDAIVVLGVGVLVVVDLLPHSFAAAQWHAAVPLILGLLGPSLVERFFLRAERQTHRVTMVVVALGFFLHAALDGAALAMNGGPTATTSVGWAVFLHRLPMGFVVWRLLNGDTPGGGRRYLFGLNAAGGVLLVIMAATVVGYVSVALADLTLHTHEESPLLGMFQALVAGSLLHIVVHAFGHHHDS